MAKERIRVVHEYDNPVHAIFGVFAEHELFGKVAGATVRRVCDGSTERNGVGSTRKLRLGPTPWFEETVTDFVTDRLIEYKVTKGSPLKNHVGRIAFEERDGGGTRVTYTIAFDTKLPGLQAVLAPVLQAGLSRGMPKAAKLAKQLVKKTS